MTRLLLVLILCSSQIASPAYDRERLSREIKEAPVIVRATVIEYDVDPPQGPRPSSGLISVYQRVRYGVMEVLKGEVMEYEIEVKHLLVPNSLTADSNTGALDREIFRAGNAVILLLGRGDTFPCRKRAGQSLCIGPFHAADVDYGAIPATEKNLELVKDLLAAGGAR